ncbi:MAG: pantoate--beta-alanine ligase [Bacillaceae bacterium]|nr:pantoate--beta-alanine ligase [Bacillaceae bacterium]
MKVFRTAEEIQSYSLNKRKEGKTIGFVPTMGYLHEGHQRLIKEARTHDDIVILSIFVNPLQFGPSEDFERYPRDEERDLKIAEMENVDAVFIPTVNDMYPRSLSITMKVTERTDVLCGKSREGHFDGVATVLTKLFHLILPHRAYFGLKDAQQVAVVDALIEDLNFPVELIPVPTVREGDGLARSSRNVYLSEEERQEAKYLYQALEHGRSLVKNGEKDRNVIINEVRNFINEHTHGKIDYVDLLTYPELQPLTHINQRVILAIAVFFNKARLIDNVIFEQNGELSYE